MRLKSWVLVFALSASSAAGAEPPRPSVITNPDWLQRPVGEDLREAYPEIARQLLMPGSATVSCKVNKIGQLEDCEILSEAPADLGFGAGALALTPKFRMRPQTRDGVPIAGADVRIPIRFTLPPSEEVAPKAVTAPPARRQLAAQIVDELELARPPLDHLADMARDWELVPFDDVPDATRMAAAGAMKSAVMGRTAQMRTAFAGILADAFTEPELRQLRAILPTPGGAVFRGDETFTELQEGIARQSARVMQAKSREAWCKSHPCPTRAELGSLIAGDGDAEVVSPTWSERPDQDQLWAATPRLATVLGVQGAARLKCVATQHGLLERCEVTVEAPGDLGFGAAALSLTRTLRLDVRTVAAGAPGKTVAVRFVFPTPTSRDTPEPLAPRSEQALTLARSLVAKTPSGGIDETFARELREFLGEMPASLPATVRAEATAVLADAEAATKTALLEDTARAYATHFTEAQLSQALTFADTPSGRALQRKGPAAFEAMTAAGGWIDDRIRDDARATFCRARPCAAAQPAAR